MARRSSLNVSLTPALERYVRAKIKSGRYESASEVIRDALRALQDRDQREVQFWDDVNAKIRVAREDVAAGRVYDGDSTMNAIARPPRARQAIQRIRELRKGATLNGLEIQKLRNEGRR